MKATMAVTLGAVLIFGPSACDGGGERLTEEEFITQANDACEEGNQEIEDAASAIGGSGQQPSEEELEGFVDDIVTAIQGQIDEIDGLNPPEDMEADVDAMVSELQSAVDEVESQGTAVLRSEDNPFADANEMAGELGLEVCAEG